MKQISYLLIVFFLPAFAQAQLSQPNLQSSDQVPDFSLNIRAQGDSCGAYFNNYIGLSKTTIANAEELRMGNISESNWYGGMAQHFHANQPIEVSGAEFYGYFTATGVDSVMAIAILSEYSAGNDSVGIELARDTVYVTHTAFSIVLPNISVKSFFDTPITVTSDYVITIENPTDDSLVIVVSDPGNMDGNGEGLGFYYYNNVNYPTFIGYYNQLTTWGAAWDFDALINPLVKYDLNDGFLLNDDSICPNVVSAACVDYTQMPVYADPHYNGFSSTQSNHLLWLWGDGFQNTNLLTACHTYTASGDYDITLRDTLRRWDFSSPYCISEVVMPIHAINDVVAGGTYSQGGTIVDFTNTSSYADSVWWDFGDTTAGTSQFNPTHDFGAIDTFDVWLYAYNECSVDSTMFQIITDDVGMEDYGLDFLMYPNPANNSVTISGMLEGAQIELLNILGQTIYHNTLTKGLTTIDTAPYNNGTYFIRISTETGQTSKKLFIRH